MIESTGEIPVTQESYRLERNVEDERISDRLAVVGSGGVLGLVHDARGSELREDRPSGGAPVDADVARSIPLASQAESTTPLGVQVRRLRGASVAMGVILGLASIAIAVEVALS